MCLNVYNHVCKSLVAEAMQATIRKAHIPLIFSTLQQNDIVTEGSVSRRIDRESQGQSGIPPSDHHEQHVRRGWETEDLTWASPLGAGLT